jgi:hypothetical protein
MADMRTKDSKSLLERMKKRYKLMYDADKDNRNLALEDIRFVNVPGAQWQDSMKQERGWTKEGGGRPCYEYNKVRVRCKRIVNDMRGNRPAGKVRAVEDGDTDTAEIYDGLIRNIWNVSHGDNATDYAAEYQVEGGMGAWRVNTAFASDSAFDLDLVIEMIENPFQLYCDPNAKESLKRDAADWIYTQRISHDEYEDRYGEKVEKVDFETDDLDGTGTGGDWIDEHTVRIAEYWYKIPVTKELWLMQVPDDDAGPDQNGQPQTKTITVDSTSDEGIALKRQGFKPERTREIKTHKIVMVVASGQKILEGPVDWPGRYFPWVMIYGEYKIIDNKKCWWGLARFAKDAQRGYNVSKTAIAETIAQASKSKVWATAAQAAGLEDQWAMAHKRNLPFQLYNPDPKAPGPPIRIGGADVPIALMQQASIDDQDIKDVMGLPDASLGQQGNESSGRAIFARQQQGEIATFNYKDNMAKGVERTMELLIDLIPEVYDTERELRILGTDGAESYKRVNQVVTDPATGRSMRINDLSAGKYDVTITVGPAFATLRQEAAEVYGQLGQQFPQLMAVAGDLIFKSMDLPYADDIAERLRTMLPPEIQQVLESDKELPPEIQQAMQQVQQAMQQVQQHGQLVQAASAELEGEKALNEKQKAEIRTEQANVKTAKAEFEAQVAEAMLKLIQKETGLVTQTANIAVKGAELKEAVADFGVKAMSETVDVAGALTTVATLDEILAKFMQTVDQAMTGLEDKASQLQVKTDRKPIGGTVSREGGRLAANVQFDDGTTKSVSAVRDQGQLRIIPG